MPIPDPRKPGPARAAAAALLLVLLTLAAFGPAANHPFVFDDERYVTGNAVVSAGITREGIVLALTRSHAANWHPVTWLSHMLDVELFGLDPHAHHRVNLALHAANAVGLLLLLAWITGAFWRSLLVAALFAVHPLRVESVAWIAERKDLLCALFWILAVAAHARHARRGGRSAYLLSLLCFALALMSKPMAVTLPFALLLLDWWPLGRAVTPGWRRLLAEKVPFLALAAAASVLTWFAQSRGGAIAPLDRIPFPERIANAALAYVAYLRTTLLPIRLAVVYPHPGPEALGWPALVAGLLLAAATVAAVRLRRRLPFLPVGWLWFLGTLVPVIGLVQVGAQGMADRYTYLPQIGLLVILVWGVARLVEGRPRLRATAVVAAAVAVLALTAAARGQTRLWRDGATLFGHAVAVTRGNWKAEYNLGWALEQAGDAAGAEAAYRRTLAIRPDHLKAQLGLGWTLLSQRRAAEAEAAFSAVLERSPDLPEALAGLAESRAR